MILKVYFLKKIKISGVEDLQKQAEAAHKEGIWSSLLEGNFEKVKAIITANPEVATQRGAMKELPLHLAFLYNSEKHFRIAKVWWRCFYVVSFSI